MAEKNKRKRKEPLSEREWNKRVRELAEAYLNIGTCHKCQSPVNNGYICYFCGDINPSEEV